MDKKPASCNGDNKRRRLGGDEVGSIEKIGGGGDAPRCAGTDKNSQLRALLHRRASLQAELDETDRQVAVVREAIEEEGGTGIDSLLVVGEDSLSQIIRYLDPRCVGRCELTCNQLRRLTGPYWEALDATLSINERPLEANARKRFIKYYLAEDLARRAEALTASHSHRPGYRTNFISCSGECKELLRPCCGGDYWKLMKKKSLCKSQRMVNTFDFFVPFAKNGTVLAQGFVAEARFRKFRQDLSLSFHNLDLSRWPDMSKIVTLQSFPSNVPPPEIRRQMFQVAKDLCVTVVAVDRMGISPTAKLALAVCGTQFIQSDGRAIRYQLKDVCCDPHASGNDSHWNVGSSFLWGNEQFPNQSDRRVVLNIRHYYE